MQMSEAKRPVVEPLAGELQWPPAGDWRQLPPPPSSAEGLSAELLVKSTEIESPAIGASSRAATDVGHSVGGASPLIDPQASTQFEKSPFSCKRQGLEQRCALLEAENARFAEAIAKTQTDRERLTVREQPAPILWLMYRL